jgi:hypothetical protein
MPVNGNQFASFIMSLPYPSGTVVLLDNARIHRTTAVQQAVTQKGYVALFIPPYCPDANPIENMFGVLKHHVRRQWGAYVLAHGATRAASANDTVTQLAELIEETVHACWMYLDTAALFERAQRVLTRMIAPPGGSDGAS